MTDSFAFSRAGWLRGSAAALAGLSLDLGGAPRIAGAQATPVQLRVGTGTVEANAQAFYAADMGFFKKNGLDVEIVKLRSGTTTMAAIVAGDLQCGVANVMSLGAAHLRGVPLVIIAPGAFYDSSAATTEMVIAPNSTIATAKELNGQTVGGISVGGLDQLAFDAYLDKIGADWMSAKSVEVPPSAMGATLDEGRIAAAAMNDPELSQALAAGKVKILAKGYDAIAKVFMQTAWFATQDWLAKNKDTAKRFSDAIVAGGVWGMANPDLAVTILAKYTSSTEQKAKMHYATKLDPALIQPVYDAAFRYKLLPAQTTAADFSWDGK